MTDKDKEKYEMIERLNRDLRASSIALRRQDVRFLVKMYYLTQEHRQQYASQARSSADSGEPHVLSQWFFEQLRRLESDLKKSMQLFAEHYRIGEWMQSIVGIGPVISSGLIANFDITLAPTCGHFERIAGLDPSREWLGKTRAHQIVEEICGNRGKPTESQLKEICERINVHHTWFNGKLSSGTRDEVRKLIAKRPWNTGLKALVCYKLGEGFVKFQNHDDDFYGALFAQYKKEESERNESGMFADQAAAALEAKNYGKDTEAYKSYSTGRLPRAHIHARARRRAVKIFISNLHEMMHLDYYGELPPVPYMFSKSPPGVHRHKIEPPNRHVFESSKKRPLRELYALSDEK